MAVLELLTATAGTEVVAADRVGCLSRRTALLFAVLGATDFVTLLVVLGRRALYLRGSFADLYLTGSFFLGRSDVEADTHEDGGRLAVHVFDHRTEEFVGLELVDEERILVFVAGVLHRVTQLIHLTQVFLPSFVDDMQDDSLLELTHDRATFTLISFAEVAADVVGHTSVGQRDHDALIDVTLLSEDLMKRRISDVGDLLSASHKGRFYCFVELVGEVISLGAAEGLLVEGRLHSEGTHDVHREALEVFGRLVRVDE